MATQGIEGVWMGCGRRWASNSWDGRSWGRQRTEELGNGQGGGEDVSPAKPSARKLQQVNHSEHPQSTSFFLHREHRRRNFGYVSMPPAPSKYSHQLQQYVRQSVRSRLEKLATGIVDVDRLPDRSNIFSFSGNHASVATAENARTGSPFQLTAVRCAWFNRCHGPSL